MTLIVRMTREVSDREKGRERASERACANESGQIEKLLDRGGKPRKRNRARDFQELSVLL